MQFILGMVLSENEQFARRCAEEGIKFIGPHLEHLDMFGDKVKARTTAINANLPVIRVQMVLLKVLKLQNSLLMKQVTHL